VGGNPADLSKLGLKSDDATIEEIELSSDRLVAKAGASDIDDAADEVLKAVANTLNDGQPVVRRYLVSPLVLSCSHDHTDLPSDLNLLNFKTQTHTQRAQGIRKVLVFLVSDLAGTVLKYVSHSLCNTFWSKGHQLIDI